MTTKVGSKPNFTSQEITQFVRNHYESRYEYDLIRNVAVRKKKASFDGDNDERSASVELELPPRTRTSQFYLTAVPDRKSLVQDTCARQKSTLEKGFFTPANVPYRMVGGRILDLKEIVHDSLEESLNKTAKDELLKTRTEKTLDKLKRSKKKILALNAWKTGGDNSFTDTLRLISKDAGFEQLKTALAESKKRMIAIQAGKPVSALLHEEERRRNVATQEKDEDDQCGMVLGKVSSHYLCHIDAGAIPHFSDGPVTAVVSHDESQFQLQAKHKYQTRKVRNFIQKLEHIHLYLVSVSNLRQNHLRRKVPLNWKFVERLRQQKPFGLRDRPGTMSSKSRASNSPLLSSLGSTSPSMVDTSPRLENSTSGQVQFQNSLLSKLVPAGEENLFQRTRRNRHRRRSTLVPAELRLDSWEEVLVVDPADHEAKRVKAPKHTPPWQVSASEYHLLSKKIVPSVKEKDNPQERLITIHQQVQELKTYQQKKLQRALENVDTERENKARKRLLCLESVDPLWHQQVEHLRRIVVSPQPEEVNSALESTPKWFSHLQTEAESVHAGADGEVGSLLAALERFSHAEIESLPGVFEKLCLIVSSQPPNEVLQPEMQRAVLFMLREMLFVEDPRDVLERWLQHRHLYVLPYL